MRHTELHRSERIGWLRAAVLGANDGIVSTASLVLGVSAGGGTRSGILIAGIAGLGYAVYSAVDQALLVDVLPNKEEAGKDLGILNMATTLGQMCGPVVMSAIVVNLGYNFAFPTSIALAIIGCFFIMAIKKVK